jgi:hypothetical protein
MWLLFPVGVLLFILGKLSVRKPPDVVAPEVFGAAEERRRAQEEADKKVEAAEAERERKLEEVRSRHSGLIKELTAEQEEKAEALIDDPAALNDYLLDVGTQVRDEDW